MALGPQNMGSVDLPSGRGYGDGAMNGENPTLQDGARDLRWNAGSWFGAQFGGSCWILLAGLRLLGSSVGLALGLVALFATLNGLGWWVWSRARRTTSPRTGYCGMLLAVGLASLVSVCVLAGTGNWSRIAVGGTLPPAVAIVIVVLVVGVTLFQIARRGRGAVAES